MSKIENVKGKLKLQFSRVKKKFTKDRKFQAYSDNLYSANFDNAQFIESCYLGQQAFRRDIERERTIEVITYTICRIKEAMKYKAPVEDKEVN